MTAFIDIQTAAKRSGKSAGHLQRLAARWASEGKARQATPPEGGKPRWYVAEEADPAFARVKWPEQLTATADLRQVPKAKREQAQARLVMLRQWAEHRGAAIKLGFDADQGTAQFLARAAADGQSISRATLYNWEARWRAEGLLGLVDGRGGAAGKAEDYTPFFAEAVRHYLNTRRVSIKVCYEIAYSQAVELGWAIPSYWTLYRHIKSIDPRVVLKQRMGERAFTDQGAAHLVRDYSTLVSNEMWCSDHHQLDVVIRLPDGKHGRPWLTAWMDLRSRKIVGWRLFAHAPNTATILAAFRDAVGGHGVPARVYVDNGKDYDSYALNGRTKRDRWERSRLRIEPDAQHTAGVFAALGVSVTHAWPYHGQSKPIERFFGTLADRFCRLVPTYCGNSPANKPDDLQLQIERGHAPTLVELTDRFAAWLAGDYHAAPHSGDAMDGRTPDVVFATYLATKITADPAVLDWLLLAPTQPVKVGQNGVTYRSRQYGRGEPALMAWLGKEVRLRIDDRDVSRVWICHPDKDTPICLAHANAYTPANATDQELREAIADLKRDNRLTEQYHDRRPRMSHDIGERILLARAAARKAAPAPADDLLPASVRPLQTPLNDQLPALRAALDAASNQLRPAVGAERISIDDLGRAVSQNDSYGGGDLGDSFDLLSRAVREQREDDQ